MNDVTIMTQVNTSNIIHHINCNQFDNRIKNLIEITVTEPEIIFFGKEFTSNSKHFKLH
jgi:hypothetical protein